MNDDEFEWDDVKAQANLRKHKISFQEARRVYDDLFALIEQDLSEDFGEDRFLATGVMNTTPVMPANKNVNPGGKNGTCSPITEFYDGTTDRIFVGMGQHLDATGANVVQMWNVTSQLTSAGTPPTASASPYLGGPSGLVIDNNANATPQAESVYFSTLVCAASNACGAGNCCAVKLTQSLLQ